MSDFSRRNLFRLLARPLQPLRPATPPPVPRPDPTRVAIIQGRHCIAITQGCRTCLKHCPEPGAIIMDAGLPIVMPDCCTGCSVCHEVCPAPTNAVLLAPRR